jgi:hypothetical protein
MIWVMALRREATEADDRTWMLATFEDKPAEAIGDTIHLEDVDWKIADIFVDSSGDDE